MKAQTWFTVRKTTCRGLFEGIFFFLFENFFFFLVIYFLNIIINQHSQWIASRRRHTSTSICNEIENQTKRMLGFFPWLYEIFTQVRRERESARNWDWNDAKSGQTRQSVGTVLERAASWRSFSAVPRGPHFYIERFFFLPFSVDFLLSGGFYGKFIDGTWWKLGMKKKSIDLELFHCTRVDGWGSGIITL